MVLPRIALPTLDRASLDNCVTCCEKQFHIAALYSTSQHPSTSPYTPRYLCQASSSALPSGKVPCAGWRSVLRTAPNTFRPSAAKLQRTHTPAVKAPPEQARNIARGSPTKPQDTCARFSTPAHLNLAFRESGAKMTRLSTDEGKGSAPERGATEMTASPGPKRYSSERHSEKRTDAEDPSGCLRRERFYD